jgi:N-acetylneuraminate synthase
MQFDIPCFKIASFENTDIPLIKKIAATGKPMIISTGMATVSELDETIRAALNSGCGDILLLKCTSSYPAQPTNTNLLTIPHMRALFDCQVGISDHTLGIGVAVASVAFGATLIEKHFTLNRADGGVDSQFSLEPEELKALAMESERAWKSIGNITYGPTDDETKTLSFRRSLYVVQDISAGDTFTQDNVRRIRPGLGLQPKYYETVLGKKAVKNIKRGTPLTWNHF